MKFHFDKGFLIIRRNALETRENGNDFNDSSNWTIFDGSILSNRDISKFFSRVYKVPKMMAQSLNC